MVLAILFPKVFYTAHLRLIRGKKRGFFPSRRAKMVRRVACREVAQERGRVGAQGVAREGAAVRGGARGNAF